MFAFYRFLPRWLIYSLADASVDSQFTGLFYRRPALSPAIDHQFLTDWSRLSFLIESTANVGLKAFIIKTQLIDLICLRNFSLLGVPSICCLPRLITLVCLLASSLCSFLDSLCGGFFVRAAKNASNSARQ